MRKSTRLKLYETVYKEYILSDGTIEEQKIRKKTSTPLVEQAPKTGIKESKSRKKKELTSYQRFFQEESKKEKYKNMLAKDRMVLIAKEWDKKKKKEKK